MLDPGGVGERLARAGRPAARRSAPAATRPGRPRARSGSPAELRIPRPRSGRQRPTTKSTASPTVSISRGLLLGDPDPVGVLELHHELVEVERVGVEVLAEAGRVRDLGRRRPRARPRGARAPSPSPRRGQASSAHPSYHACAAAGRARALEQLAGALDRPLARPRGPRAGSRSRCPPGPSCRGRRPPRRAGRAGSRRRWCRGPARAAGRRAPGAAAGRRRAATGFERAASPTAPATALRGSLHRLQRDVAGEAVGDDRRRRRVAEQVAALDVAAEVDRRPRSRERRRGPRPPRASPSSPPRRPRAARPAGARRRARRGEGGAEVGELDQVAGRGLGVGADVEQQRRRAVASRDRQLDARAPAGGRRCSAPQREQRRGHRRPGRPGADQRLRAALGDVGGGAARPTRRGASARRRPARPRW